MSARTRPPRSLPGDEPERVRSLMQLLFALEDPLPDPETEAGREARAFFQQCWLDARDGLLARTTRLTIEPASSFAPRLFRWVVQRPYKRRASDGQVELASGPIRGTIHYRGDALTAPRDELAILVRVDPDLAIHHPNIDPVTSLVCHGLREVLPLEAVALQLYSIVSFQNMGLTSPLCREAANYFAHVPGAKDGLEPVEPLY